MLANVALGRIGARLALTYPASFIFLLELLSRPTSDQLADKPSPGQIDRLEREMEALP